LDSPSAFSPAKTGLILNTEGTGSNTTTLVREIREHQADLPVLHIGTSPLEGMPANVPTLDESFTADELLTMVRSLLPVIRGH
jgi:hypothetical protein